MGGWCQVVSEVPLLNPRVRIASHTPTAPWEGPRAPLGSRLLPKAFLFVWLHGGPQDAPQTPRPSPSLWLRAGRDPRGGGQWLRERTLRLRSPLESGKHLDFFKEGRGSPTQFFLVLGVSYFLLLEYQSSRGMPMEGRVMTPKAAQSRKWGENLLSNSR